ncbi:metal ABC transporter permease [Ectothiorhodospira sp. BSL-9]|uniref:metal ABC transporter permease n=1 Tax=Ectothiorhodospira sp. BSL-9 TaxID=1442136 RepID=UPI0007B44653|nr:metal ABC transporter permease [Ectothiorhodospira sp. BSL-9]ANB02837.1 ABC transporter [Ectothiorhodospira sp. BSL-9]TVQ74289.1 MAG: ABC transporter [Chromatiaceae bacterium]
MLDLLFDPLFRLPFVTGLLLAPVAAIAGVYLRLREEWLAALAYAQVAAAGAVVAVVFHAPVMLGALAAAGLVATVKGLLANPGNHHFVVFILLGWGVALVAGSFSAHGEMVGQSLMDGQLYFTGKAHLLGALALLVLGMLCMSWLSQRLLMDRFFPDYFSANGIPAWRHRVAFDWLVVAIVAVATTTFGVMAAFALLFIPAWVAWGLAQGWRNVLIIAAALAVAAYVVAFVVAVAVDQPFGPVLVLTLCATALLRFARRGFKLASPSVASSPTAIPDPANRR